MSYFKNFPNISIPIEGNEVSVKDILRRVKISDEVFENDSVYDYYRLSDGETLRDVARKTYGDEKLDWVLILYNSIIDPFFSTPLNTNEFEEFVESKYAGQALFCSTVGSSLPFFLNRGSFDVGDFVAEKKLGENNERIFTDTTKSATVKDVDPALSKIQLFKQKGTFAAGEKLVNRTQFPQDPSATVTNVLEENAEAGVTETINSQTGETTITINSDWTPENAVGGSLVGWYRPEGYGTSEFYSGGETITYIETISNSASAFSGARTTTYTSFTQERKPPLGTNGYNGYSYVDLSGAPTSSGTSGGYQLGHTGDFDFKSTDSFFLTVLYKTPTLPKAVNLFDYPAMDVYRNFQNGFGGVQFTRGVLGDTPDYRERYIQFNINNDFIAPNGVLVYQGSRLQTSFHSNRSVLQGHQPLSPRENMFGLGQPNILTWGRGSGSTLTDGSGMRPFFRINGKEAHPLTGYNMLGEGSDFISSVNLEKVQSGDHSTIFSLTDVTDPNRSVFGAANGDWYEMIIYKGFTAGVTFANRDPAFTAMMERTEGYLAHKYGLEAAVLPGTHPYSVEKPTITSDVLIDNEVPTDNGTDVAINVGAEGDERLLSITKVVKGEDAPKQFVLNPGGSTIYPLNPFASAPDDNNYQTPIGMTSASFDSGLTSVTYGSTILYDYIINNNGQYVLTNKLYEQNLNEAKRRIRLPRPAAMPVIIKAFERAIKS